MKKLPILLFPYASTSAINEPVLVDEERGLLLSMCCDDEGLQRPFGILFIKPRAFRKRGEIYCTEWHVNDVYDTVCEIEESDWVQELRCDAVPDLRDYWVMRHFMVYADSFGCLEIVAESVILEE